MRIAITSDSNHGLESAVAQHFGHAPYFTLVDVDAGAVIAVQSVANPFAHGHAPGDVPSFIHQQGAQVMLSGGMGGRAIQLFAQLGIQAATGAQGTVRQALTHYLGGALQEAAPCAESVAHGHA